MSTNSKSKDMTAVTNLRGVIAQEITSLTLLANDMRQAGDTEYADILSGKAEGVRSVFVNLEVALTHYSGSAEEVLTRIIGSLNAQISISLLIPESEVYAQSYIDGLELALEKTTEALELLHANN